MQEEYLVQYDRNEGQSFAGLILETNVMFKAEGTVVTLCIKSDVLFPSSENEVLILY